MTKKILKSVKNPNKQMVDQLYHIKLGLKPLLHYLSLLLLHSLFALHIITSIFITAFLITTILFITSNYYIPLKYHTLKNLQHNIYKHNIKYSEIPIIRPQIVLVEIGLISEQV